MNEVDEAAEKARNSSLVPEKSKEVYGKTYNEYLKWCDIRKDSIENCYCEKSLLAYFWYLSKERKPSSLWSYYSMLKATIKANHNIDISSYSSLFGFLKRKSEGFKPKKSKVLTIEEIEAFIYQAPDEIYLMNKVIVIYFNLEVFNQDFLKQVALIFGIAGACRKQELVQLEVDDI